MEPTDPNKYWITIETKVIDNKVFTIKTKKWIDDKNQSHEKILSKSEK